MCWNPVLDFFVEVKNTFIECWGEEKLWDYQHNGDSFTNCVSYWTWWIANTGHHKRHYYNDIIHNLLINEYDGMILLKYKDLDIDWDAYNGFYMECRSVVIDIYNNKLILTPFRKFRNINECEENQIDRIRERIKNASRVEITDKLDGSMVSARFYNNRIVISGSQALDENKSYRLHNYYDWVFTHNNIFFMLVNNPNCTFIFEGIFPDDTHVVQYDESMWGLHLIGVRGVYTGVEWPYYNVVDIAEQFNVPHVKIFDMTFDEAYQDTLNNGRLANEGEGYVIDIDGYKVKVKYTDYVLIHKAIGNMLSHNAILNAIHEGRWDDFYSKIPLAYQPQAKEIADNIFDYIQIYSNYVDKWWHTIIRMTNYTTDRKTFMIAVNENVPKRYQGAVRAWFLGKEIDYLHGVKYVDILDYLDFIQAMKN